MNNLWSLGSVAVSIMGIKKVIPSTAMYVMGNSLQMSVKMGVGEKEKVTSDPQALPLDPTPVMRTFDLVVSSFNQSAKYKWDQVDVAEYLTQQAEWLSDKGFTIGIYSLDAPGVSANPKVVIVLCMDEAEGVIACIILGNCQLKP